MDPKFSIYVLNNSIKINNILLLTDGRDKIFKLIQYTLSLLIHTSNNKPNLKYKNIILMFSNTRKVIRLANSISSFNDMIKLININCKYNINFLYSILSFLNCICDDVYCLSKFNIINKRLGFHSGHLSSKFWFSTLSIDLYLNICKYKDIKLKMLLYEKIQIKQQFKKELINIKINIIKIVFDIIFCMYDLLLIENNLIYKDISALISGYISFFKLWNKN